MENRHKRKSQKFKIKMLTDATVHPTLPVVDLERARKFYREKLGLKVRTDLSPGAGESTMPYIHQRAVTKADHTGASFTAKDVEATVM